MLLFQKCTLGNVMGKSPLKLQSYDCNGSNFTLSNCNALIKEPFGTESHKEYTPGPQVVRFLVPRKIRMT